MKIPLFCILLILSFTEINMTSSSSDPDDILKGKGFFSQALQAGWVMNSTELAYELGPINGTEDYLLVLEKNATAQLSFNDGLILQFNSNKPKHVRFYFAPSFVDNENTNLRLKNSNTSKTVLSFRCGNAGFIRVNDNQMIDFYNDTISNKTQIIWSKMDLILNWEDQNVKIYLNETFKGTSGFYHPDVPTVDTLMLYNLKPGTTSFWRSLQVCETQCEGFTFSTVLKNRFLASIIFILIITFLF